MRWNFCYLFFLKGAELRRLPYSSTCDSDKDSWSKAAWKWNGTKRFNSSRDSTDAVECASVYSRVAASKTVVFFLLLLLYSYDDPRIFSSSILPCFLSFHVSLRLRLGDWPRGSACRARYKNRTDRGNDKQHYIQRLYSILVCYTRRILGVRVQRRDFRVSGCTVGIPFTKDAWGLRV